VRDNAELKSGKALTHGANKTKGPSAPKCSQCRKALGDWCWQYKLTSEVICDSCHEYKKKYEERESIETARLRDDGRSLEDVARRES